MQTSIIRARRVAKKHRRHDSISNTAELLRRLAWLSWPLLHWSGPLAPASVTGPAPARTLHERIVANLRFSVAGLYVLRPLDGQSDEVHLLAVTGLRLAQAAHELALVRQAEARVSRGSADDAATREGLESRLHLLSQGLREVAEPDTHSRGCRPLGRLAWRVAADEVHPPLELRGYPHRNPEVIGANLGSAIMEFVLRTGSSSAAPIVESLRVLIAECQAMDDEPARRRQLYGSLLKAAMAIQPAYFEVYFPIPGRMRITKWKPNRYFLQVAVEVFFRDYLPAAAVREFSGERQDRFSFEQMCEWLLGGKAPDFAWEPTLVSLHPLGRLESLAKVVGAPSLGIGPAEKDRLLGLAARCAAITGDPEVPRHFATWLQACRHVCRLRTANENIWTSAVSCLESSIMASEFDPANLRQFLALLAARSMELASWGWIAHPIPPAAFWSLAQLGALSREDALAVIDLRMIVVADTKFSEKPEQLSAFLAFVSAYHRPWLAVKDWVRDSWIQLFSSMQNPAVLPALHRWIAHLMKDRSFTFIDVSNFIEEVVDFFPAKSNPAERARREIFLLKNLPWLDRLLDEVEACQRALPETGFDSWRAHDVLWRYRFAAFEFAYQWEAAGYDDLPRLLDELFAWCRKYDRGAMGRGEDYPTSHFRNGFDKEVLLVSLSAGEPRRLSALLDYYTGDHHQAENPLAAWRFLDRYPAVQQAFQEFCQQPNRLRGVMRVLRRLSLALRLQRREILHAKLERWVAASAVPEPLLALRAFGELAGDSEPLPSAVERVLSRQEKLQRECDTLRGCRLAGQATPSALVRLAKLERLIVQPEVIAAWVEKDTRRLATKLLPLAKASALNEIVWTAVCHHWKEVIDRGARMSGRDWENALHFYYSAEKNKDLLRKLLRHVQTSDAWRREEHAPNVKFLEELRANGFAAASWLEGYRSTFLVHGEEWSVRLEQDPLRVLQMGNLFGTCLSVDDSNAFSAIANAVEVNKQILYLENREGTVIGRKLIGLTAAGRFFGFRSYGAACLWALDRSERPQVWIKILFDLACLALVQRVQGQFDQSADAEASADELRLTAEWYNDGPEAFDWWIAQPELTDHILRGERAPVAAAVLRHVRQNTVRFDDTDSRSMETLRALLWLGDDAAPVVEALGHRAFGPKSRRFLQRQSPSAQVRASLHD